MRNIVQYGWMHRDDIKSIDDGRKEWFWKEEKKRKQHKTRKKKYETYF